MVILNHPQGSTEWLTARLWRLTASGMKPVITATGALSKSEKAIEHIDKLIAGIDLANIMLSQAEIIEKMDERELKRFMANYNGDSFTGSHHTERGHDCEPDAIAAISDIIGTQLADVGMCIMGDDVNGVVSCSPDSLEYTGGKLAAGAEVKAPCLCKYYSHVAAGILPDDYKLQVHASMAICEVDDWHFGSYFTGKPLFYVKVTRNKLTDAIAASLREFQAVYRERYDVVMSKMETLKERSAA